MFGFGLNLLIIFSMWLLIAINIGFIAVNIGMAEWEAYLKKGSALYVIHHGLWMVLYFGICIPVAFFAKDWWLLLVSALARGVIFDVAFNMARKFAPNFQSSKTTSIVDHAERWIFGNDFWLEKITYSVLWIAVNVLIVLKVLK